MPRGVGKGGTLPWAPGYRGLLQILISNYLSCMYGTALRQLHYHSRPTRSRTTHTHSLKCRVQFEYLSLGVNITLYLSYNRHICEGTLLYLAPMFYKALCSNNNLLSCLVMFIIISTFATITLPCRLIKSASCAEQKNLYRSKISLTVNKLR